MVAGAGAPVKRRRRLSARGAVRDAEGPEHVEADPRPAEGPEVVVELVHEPAIAPATIGGARPVASAALGPAAVENDLNRGIA